MENLHTLAQKINNCLEKYSDKDWNYSRISLQVLPIEAIAAPYALVLEVIPTDSQRGQAELKTLRREIEWGDHHSNELGFLELASLRLNKAFLAVAHGLTGESQYPVLRLAKIEDLRAQNASHALWYEVTEVSGEEFDSR
jgi:hypothetical protein